MRALAPPWSFCLGVSTGSHSQFTAEPKPRWVGDRGAACAQENRRAGRSVHPGVHTSPGKSLFKAEETEARELR